MNFINEMKEPTPSFVGMSPDLDTFETAFANQGPSVRLSDALRVIGTCLWLVLEQEGYRQVDLCVLTSCSVKRFLNGLGFEAEVTPAIMCVFANRKEVQGVLPMQPLVLGLPDPDRGELGMHVVVVVKDTDGRRWLVDSSCAQARRERWGVTLPGVFIVELRPALPDGPGDDIWRHFGFSPATGPVSWSSDSDIVALYWYLAPGRDNGWTRAPDARRERSRRIAIKLRKVWASRP